DGAVHVAVDVLGTDLLEDAVGIQHGQDVWLDAREVERQAGRLRELGELGQLRRSLGVDEVHALEVEYEAVQSLPAVGELPHAFLEGVGGSEEEPAVQP